MPISFFLSPVLSLWLNFSTTCETSRKAGHVCSCKGELVLCRTELARDPVGSFSHLSYFWLCKSVWLLRLLNGRKVKNLWSLLGVKAALQHFLAQLWQCTCITVCSCINLALDSNELKAGDYCSACFKLGLSNSSRWLDNLPFNPAFALWWSLARS